MWLLGPVDPGVEAIYHAAAASVIQAGLLLLTVALQLAK
jgi:hypothetical protein